MQKIHPILRDAYVTFSYFFSPILIKSQLRPKSNFIHLRAFFTHYQNDK